MSLVPLLDIDNKIRATDILFKDNFIENCELVKNNYAQEIIDKVKAKLWKIESYGYHKRDKYHKLITTSFKDVNIVLNFLKTNFFPTKTLFNIKIKIVWNPSIYIKFYDNIQYSQHIRTKFNQKLLKKTKQYKPGAYINIIENIDNIEWLRACCHARNYNYALEDTDYIFIPRQMVHEKRYFWHVSFKTETSSVSTGSK